MDKSAGTEGLDFVPLAGSNSFGRYEVALLCLGMMHFHFGHPKLALEVSFMNILTRAPHFYLPSPQQYLFCLTMFRF